MNGWVLCAASVAVACTQGRERAPFDATVELRDASRADSAACSSPALQWLSGAEDTHCRTDSERLLQQQVARCTPGDGDVPEAPVLLNGRGPDADCKYTLELADEDCFTLLRVHAGTRPVEEAKARAELRDASGAVLFEGVGAPRGGGAYGWRFPAEALQAAAVLHVHLFEQCAYTDEASPRAHASFSLAR